MLCVEAKTTVTSSNCNSQALAFQPISRLEYPAQCQHAGEKKHRCHGKTYANVHVGQTVEAPAETADEIDDRIEKRHRLPEWRQHFYRIEAATEECERRYDHQRNELQLFKTISPDADDEAEHAEGNSRQHQE